MEDEWTVHKSTRNGLTYWHNKITKQSQWTPPKSKGKTPPVQDANAPQSPRKQHNLRKRKSEDSPSFDRLQKVAQKLKTKSPRKFDRKLRVQLSASPEAKFSQETSPEAQFSPKKSLEKARKRRKNGLDILSKPLDKAVFTKKSPLVAKTFTKDQLKSPKKKSKSDAKSSAPSKTKTNLVDYGESSGEDWDAQKSGKIGSKEKSESDEWTYDEINVKRPNTHSSLRHVPKNRGELPTVRDLFSFKVETPARYKSLPKSKLFPETPHQYKDQNHKDYRGPVLKMSTPTPFSHRENLGYFAPAKTLSSAEQQRHRKSAASSTYTRQRETKQRNSESDVTGAKGAKQPSSKDADKETYSLHVNERHSKQRQSGSSQPDNKSASPRLHSEPSDYSSKCAGSEGYSEPSPHPWDSALQSPDGSISSPSNLPPWIQKRRRSSGKSSDLDSYSSSPLSTGSASNRMFTSDNDGRSTSPDWQTGGRPTFTVKRSLSVFSSTGQDEMEFMDVDPETSEALTQDLNHLRQNLNVPTTEVLGSFTQRLINHVQPMDVSYSHNVPRDKQLFVIVDTNILMHNLKYIDELKDECFPVVGRPVLVIPWVVIQELDALKNSKKLDEVAINSKLSAQRPISYLNKMLESNHRRLVGQTPKQAEEEVTGITIENNDDKVLKCCLQWRTLYPLADVVLLTLDKNLQNKSRVMGIPAYDHKTLRGWLSSKSEIQRQPSSSTSGGSMMSVGIPKIKDMEPVLVDDLSCELKSQLRDCLTPVLQQEMQEIYGQQWIDIVYRKPPWTLDDLLASINKHWIAVFGLLLNESRSIKPHLDNLLNHFKPGSGYGKNLRQLSVLLKDALIFLRALREFNSYDGQIGVAVGRLSQLEQLALNVLNGKRPIMDLASLEKSYAEQNEQTKEPTGNLVNDSVQATDEAQINQLVLDNFQCAWETILETKNCIITHMNSSSFGTSRRQDALELFRNFHGVLNPVHEAYQLLLNAPALDINIFNRLADSLHNLALSLSIQQWQPWSGELIQLFFGFSEANRNILKNGFEQLLQFVSELHQCWMNLLPEEQAAVQQ